MIKKVHKFNMTKASIRLAETARRDCFESQLSC